MINIAKISKIKNKNDLKKYNIQEPIFLGNYLFHYLIITNNLNGLKLTKYPIYKENNEGMNGLHLAATIANETNNFNILNYLLKEYPLYSNNYNKFSETFLDMLDINTDIIDIINTHKKINWFRLFTNVVKTENFTQCYINKVFRLGNNKLIKLVLDILLKNNFSWKEFECNPIFEIPHNTNLTTKQKINIFEKIGIDNILILIDYNGRNIVYPIIESNNYNLLKYVIMKKINLDKYTFLHTEHPFISAYIKESEEIFNKNKSMTQLIWDNIKNIHDFESVNKYNENIAFTIMEYRLDTGNGIDSIEEEVLIKNNIWNKQNINKDNLFNIITDLSFKKYSKIMKKNKNIYFNANLKNKENILLNDTYSSKWKNYLLTLSKVNNKLCNKEINVKINKYKHVNSNTFSATLLDTALFFIYLDKKYKNLYIPKYIDSAYDNINWENGYVFPDYFVNEYNNFPWTIFWTNQFEYYIHPYLNILINANKNKYDCSIVLLSVLLPHGGLHAMILYYDFKNNTIERFDPYGNTFDMDMNIDSILEEELTWNTGFSYVNVKDYLPIAGFQNLSDENNILNQKPGDFGGFCLAWCLWYLELRLKNLNCNSKVLVKKAISKLLKTESSINNFIRNYANNIDKYRLLELEQVGIDKLKASNITLDNKEILLIIEYIIKNLTISY